MARSKNGTSFDIAGPAGAPVVVLIHGLGLTRASTWAKIAPELARDYLVLSYDLCGHGETVVPDGPVDLTVLSNQLIALLDELGIAQAALVGFSLGGMINRRCAIDHPERVSALAILNSPHDRGEEQQRLVEDRARNSASAGPAAGIDVTLARWFTEAFRKDHSDIVDGVREVVLANDPENYAAHRQVLAEGVVELIRPNPPLRHPALVITCENDSGSTPEMSHAIASEIEGSETRIIPKLQHLGLIEDPIAFSTPIKAFLRRVIG